MPLLRRRERKDEVSELANKIKIAKSREELDSLESDLAALELKKSEEELRGIYAEFARKYMEVGEYEKAYYYASKTNERELTIEILEKWGKYDEIIKKIEEWKDAKFYLRLFKSLWMVKKYESIVEKYEKFYKESKDLKILYYVSLAFLSMGMGERVADLIEEIEKKAKSKEDMYILHYIKGKYYEISGKYKEAIEEYGEAIKYGKDKKDALLGMARCHYFLENIVEVEKIIVELPRDDARTKALEALVMAKKGFVKGALKLVDNVLEKEELPDAILAKCIIMYEHGIEGVEKYLEKIISVEPNNPIALKIKAKIVEKENSEEAKEIYSKLLKINPNDPEVYVALAKLGKWEEKKNYAEKALEINPNIVEARMILGEYYLDISPEKTVEYLKDIEDPYAFYLCGIAYEKMGDMGKAEEYLRRALTMDKKNILYKKELAKVVMETKKEEAEILLRDVLRENPEDREAKIYLASIIYEEHPEEAYELLKDIKDRDVIKLKIRIARKLGYADLIKKLVEKMADEVDVETLFALAEVSEGEDAIDILNRILNIDPTNTKAKIMLAEKYLEENPKKSLEILKDVDSKEAYRIAGMAYESIGDKNKAYESYLKCADEYADCLKKSVEIGKSLGKYKEILEYAKKLVEKEESVENLKILAEIYSNIDEEEAYEIYRNITMKNPRDKVAWEFLCNYYKKRNKFKDAAKCLEKLYEITKDINYLIEKADILEDLGDYNELYETYGKILASDPTLEDIEDRRDMLLIKMGRYDELIQYAEYWLSKKRSKAAKGYYLRALGYKNLGKIKDALENISKAISLSKKKEYRLLYAEILYSIGRYSEAYEVLEKLREDDETIMLKAKILIALGKKNEAMKLLKKAADMNIKEAYGEIANLYISMGKMEEAAEYIDRAADFLKDPNVFISGAKLFYNLGNYGKALRYVNKYIKERPNYEEGWLIKTMVLLRMNKIEEALNSVNNLIKLSQKEEYLLLKAHILNKMKMYSEALEILGSIGDIEFEGIRAMEEKAWALYCTGRYSESRKIYGNLGNMAMVARCLYEEGRYSEILSMEVEDSKVWEIKGDVYMKKGIVNEAKKCYSKSIALDESNASAIKKLAKIYFDEGMYNEAFDLYSKVNDEESMVMRGKILENWGSYSEAADIYLELFSRMPNKENGLRAAKSLAKVAKYSEGLEILNKLPEDEDILLEKAKLLYLKGDYQKSLSLLRRLEREDFEVYRLLGDNYLAIGRTLRAKDYYEKCLKIREDKEVLKSLGKVYEILNDYSKAAEMYIRCGDEESYERAERILRRMGDKEKLRELYENMLKKGADIEIMKKLAEIYEEMKMYREAVKLYEDIKNYEFSAEILRKLGVLNLKMGNIDDAEKYAKTSLEIEESEDGYLLMGRIYLAKGMYDRAKEMYMKCRENKTLYKEISRLSSLTGDVKNALEFGEKSVREIGDGEAWFLYGVALSLAGDYENAIKSLRIAEEKNYPYSEIREELAKIYIQRGDYSRALKILEYIETDKAKLLKALCNAKIGEIGDAYQILENLQNGDSLAYLGDCIMHKIFGKEIAEYPYEIDNDSVKRAISIYSEALRKPRNYVPDDVIMNNMGIANICVGNFARGAEELEASMHDDVNILNSLIILDEKDEVEKRIRTMEETHTKDYLYWNAVAIYMAKCKNYSEALQKFNMAEELCKDKEIREMIVFNRAVLLTHLGMYKSASELLTSVSIKDSLLLRAYAYLKMNMLEESKKNYYEYIKHKKDDSVMYNLAYIEYSAGNYDDALKLINEAIKQNPKESSYWNLKGILLSLKGKYEDALRCFDVALFHNRRDEKVWNNKAVALILSGKYEEAVDILKRVNSELKDFNLGCAYYRMGEYVEAERCFRRYYEKTRDEETLYNIFKSSVARGEPPELKKKYSPTKTEHILSDLLLSHYGVRITAVPKFSANTLVYSLGIKNVSGDTINPFVLTPFGEFGAGMTKKIGPIRPYEEVWTEFRTNIRAEDLKGKEDENPLIPGEDVDIRHIIYSRGIGAVDEVRVKNLRNYPLENIIVSPSIPQGFGVYNENFVIDKLDAGEEKVVRFALLPIQALKELREYEKKYSVAKPRFETVDIKETAGSYKYLFRLHLFHFSMPHREVDYDLNIAKELIKKERRKLLVKAVEEVGEAIVSVEK